MPSNGRMVENTPKYSWKDLLSAQLMKMLLAKDVISLL